MRFVKIKNIRTTVLFLNTSGAGARRGSGAAVATRHGHRKLHGSAIPPGISA